MVTGTPSTLTLALVELSGGVLTVTLILAMVICILLGMGMPTIAAYLLVALLIAPTIVQGFQIRPIVAHFFVFYSANLSTITPPIAASVVVATGIAGSNFWKTAFQSIRISAPIFVLPFMFIYRPEVITPTITLEMVRSGVVGLVGALILVYGLNYPNTRYSLPKYVGISIVFAVIGIFIMITPDITLNIIAIILSVILIMVLNLSASQLLASRLKKRI